MAYTPNKNREIKNGKAVVSAAELADFRKTAGENATLRDLLNADKGLERRSSSPRVIPQVKPSMQSGVSPDSVKNIARNSGVKMASEQTSSTPEPKNVSRVNEENMDTSDMSLNRKGGAIKMAKGGSASSRGDGIAQKGKTRGTMVMCGGGYMKGKK